MKEEMEKVFFRRAKYAGTFWLSQILDCLLLLHVLTGIDSGLCRDETFWKFYGYRSSCSFMVCEHTGIKTDGFKTLGSEKLESFL